MAESRETWILAGSIAWASMEGPAVHIWPAQVLLEVPLTAIAAYPGPDAIVFAADGAMYDLNGVVMGFVSKLYDLPQGDGVYGSVGIYGFLDEFEKLLTGSFDDVVETLVETARLAYRNAEGAWMASDVAPRATLIIGGWSQVRQQFELYKLHSSEKAIINTETGEQSMALPWTVIPVPGMWASSAPKEEIHKAFGIDFGDQDFNAVDMVARIVCANRAQSGRGDHDGMYGVGGFLEMVIVHAGGIVRWDAHEWPDQIGAPIDPDAGDAMPSFPLVIPWPAI